MKNILVLGDWMTDVWWVGKMRGISAEATIPVIKIITKLTFDGGAGNVFWGLRKLGVRSLLPLIQNVSPCPIKNRLVLEDGTQLARWDERDWCEPIEVCDTDRRGPWDAIVVADYAKGAITEKYIESIDAPMWFVDSRKSPRWWTDLIAPDKITFFPNLKEYAQYHSAFDSMPNVVLKLGPEGLCFRQYGVPLYSEPATARKVVSVCGAGDTVMAAYVMASLRGDSPATALTVAAFAGGIACEKPYTSVVTLQELEDVLICHREG